MARHVPRPAPYACRVKRGASGLGLFADESIPRGKFVIEYWGKVVSEDEGNRIGGKYLFDLENGKMIVGTTRKNVARYINHSCKPNCEIEYRGNRVYIYSRKAIKPGDELTYDYGKEYFDWFIKPHGCRCGACRATTRTRAASGAPRRARGSSRN